jgi:hypothetical protein
VILIDGSPDDGEEPAALSGDTKDDVTSRDQLPGSQLGAGILSDKSFAALAPLVSDATLKVRRF